MNAFAGRKAYGFLHLFFHKSLRNISGRSVAKMRIYAAVMMVMLVIMTVACACTEKKGADTAFCVAIMARLFVERRTIGFGPKKALNLLFVYSKRGKQAKVNIHYKSNNNCDDASLLCLLFLLSSGLLFLPSSTVFVVGARA